MKKFWIIVPLTALLVSCAPRTAADDYYIPQKAWEGAETRAYSLHDSFFVNEIPHGNPDPAHVDGYAPIAQPERIEVKTDKTHYRTDEEVTVQVTYRPAAPTETEEGPLYLHGETNLERWNGTSWDRMITTQFLATEHGTALNPTVPERYLLDAGETKTRTYSLPHTVTVLTPGRYRVVVYLNNAAFYAEFELME